jgi:hypothetical protein
MEGLRITTSQEAGILADIRTENLPDTSPDRDHYTIMSVRVIV